MSSRSSSCGALPGDRARENRGNIGGAQCRPIGHEPGATAFDAVEDSEAAEPRQPQLPFQAPAYTVADGAPFGEPLACELDAPRDRTRPALGHRRRRQLVFISPCHRLYVLRHVDAACPPIAAEVLPEIRQLKRRA